VTAPGLIFINFDSYLLPSISFISWCGNDFDSTKLPLPESLSRRIQYWYTLFLLSLTHCLSNRRLGVIAIQGVVWIKHKITVWLLCNVGCVLEAWLILTWNLGRRRFQATTTLCHLIHVTALGYIRDISKWTYRFLRTLGWMARPYPTFPVAKGLDKLMSIRVVASIEKNELPLKWGVVFADTDISLNVIKSQADKFPMSSKPRSARSRCETLSETSDPHSDLIKLSSAEDRKCICMIKPRCQNDSQPEGW